MDERKQVLTYPFPLKDGQMAEIRLPRPPWKIDQEDTKRLMAFIQCLAVDV